MGHYLNVSQLAELCLALDLHDTEQRLVTATEIAAEALAIKLGVTFLSARNDPGFGGLCAKFGPKFKGQKCPELLKQYDPSSDWQADSCT